MDSYGYSSWIQGLKELVDFGRVELVGSGAYHPLLPKLTEKYIESEIILNEYGLGYYFGKHTGFDGEKSIMVQDLTGFFPPEMALDMPTLNILDGLGYSWVVVDECAMATAKKTNPRKYSNVSSGAYGIKGKNISAICRDRGLSNLISFKRNTNIDDIMSYLDGKSSYVICLDAEFFGHHYKEGLFVLDFLFQEVTNRGGSFETLSDILAASEIREIDEIDTSSWAASDQDVLDGNYYPLWENPENKIQKLQWELFNRTLKEFKDLLAKGTVVSDYETAPVWKPEFVSKMDDGDLKKQIILTTLVNSAFHSDQFWWASKKYIIEKIFLYNPPMIEKSLDVYSEIAKIHGDPDFSKFVEEKAVEIKSLL